MEREVEKNVIFINRENVNEEMEDENEIIKCYTSNGGVNILFLSPKIISIKLYCKYYFFLRFILLENDSNELQNIKDNLTKYFNITKFDNEDNLIKFQNELKSDLEKEHKKDTESVQEIINEHWYYIIIEHMLMQILIPSMNHIDLQITMNYYIYDDLSKLKKKKYLQRIIKEFEKKGKYSLKKTLKSSIIAILSKEKDNSNGIIDHLINLYENIIKGKEKWFRKKQLLSDNAKLLFDFDSTSEDKNKSISYNKEDLLLHLFLFTFIANRIKTSPLNPSNDVDNIFNINLSQANVKQEHLLYILIPIQFESNIHGLILNENIFNKLSLYQLAISCFINNNIHTLDISRCKIDSTHISGLLEGLIEIENFKTKSNQFNITSLNMSKNESFGNEMSTIIQKMQKLKTLIVNYIYGRDAQRHYACLFNSLDKMYRYKQTCLEDLYIMNSKLNNHCICELANMLKSYCCGLKLLALSKIETNTKYDILIKKLKYNRSLIELYLIEMNINEKDEELLLKIIPNTFIRKLTLYRNNIRFKTNVKLIAQTQIDCSAEREDNHILVNEPTMREMDLSEQYEVSNKKQQNEIATFYEEEEVLLMLDVLSNSKLKVIDLRKDFIVMSKKALSAFEEKIENVVNKGIKIFC